VLAPVPQRIVDDVLGKQEFVIDMTAGTVTCPAGQTVTIRTSPSGSRAAYFAQTGCRDCLLKPRCCPTKPFRQIKISEHEHSRPVVKRCATRSWASTYAAPDPGSNGYSDSSRTATALARAATSAAPRPDYTPRGRLPWSI
jgi:hypothetical protein